MIAVLAFTGMITSFVQTLVIPLQPELPDLLSASRDDTTWVVTVTLLVATVTAPIAGRLGDLYGRRRMIVVLLLILMAGSVVCALSFGLTPLIVGRSLQGVSTGTIPLGISILRDVLHRNRLTGAIALVSATLGVGAAVGLPISAVISQTLDWHWLFWLSTILAVLALSLVLLVVPPSTLVTRGRVDIVGAMWLAAGLSAALLAVSKGAQWGWLSPATLGCGCGGVAVLLLWGWFELRQSSPIVDLRVAARPAVLRTNVASIAVGFALFTTAIALPQLLALPRTTGVGLGQSLVATGLILMPSGLVMMLMSPVSARLGRTVGARLLLAMGASALALSYVVGFFFMTEVWHVLVVAVLNGIGVGLGYAAMPTLIMNSVPATATAAANGLNTLMRSLGMTAAAAVIGAVLASMTVSTDGVTTPSLNAFRVVFAVGFLASLGAAVLALTVPRTALGSAHQNRIRPKQGIT